MFVSLNVCVQRYLSRIYFYQTAVKKTHVLWLKTCQICLTTRNLNSADVTVRCECVLPLSVTGGVSVWVCLLLWRVCVCVIVLKCECVKTDWLVWEILHSSRRMKERRREKWWRQRRERESRVQRKQGLPPSAALGQSQLALLVSMTTVTSLAWRPCVSLVCVCVCVFD